MYKRKFSSNKNMGLVIKQPLLITKNILLNITTLEVY